MQINGNLVLNADATGEIQNAFIQRLSAAPTFSTADVGRIYFDTTALSYYFNNGTTWVAFAAGGSTATITADLNNLLASVGTAVKSDGTWNGSVAFSGDAILSAATSITNALSSLSTATTTKALAGLTDVVLTSPTNNQVLSYNTTTSKWNNTTLTLSRITDVTATATEVNLLHGATFTTVQLNYVTGVTSSIQSQLNALQPSSAALSAITALGAAAGTGIIVQTGVNTFSDRSLVAPARGFNISNPAGVAGNPTFLLANNLAALEGLASTGIIVLSADGVMQVETITGAAGRIVVSNGSGVAGAPLIDLATITQGTTGTFQKFTVDGYARVVSTTPVVMGDITGLVGTYYLPSSGGTMSGSIAMGSNSITGLLDPVVPSGAATKNYVDNAIAGLTWKDAVTVLAAVNVTVSSPGATIDGVTMVAGYRVLLTAQTTTSENGIYVFNTSTTALTRSTDAATPGDLSGAALFVESGTSANSAFVQTTNPLTAFGSETWSKFSGGAVYTSGNGISISGTAISVVPGAGISFIPGTDVGINLYSSASSAIILTTDGSTRSTASTAALALLLSAAGGLVQDTTGLHIGPAAVTNAMLLNSAVTVAADSGTSGSLALGSSLSILGTAARGISTAVTGTSVTITAALASTAALGVAQFSSSSFSVASGVVSIAAAGISNVMLASSSITVTGTTGTTSPALGSTLAIIGDTTSGTSIAVTTGQVAISVRAATATLLGVASFSSTDFSVVAGAVSLVPKSLNSLTNVIVSTPVEGQVLSYNGTTAFINRTIYYLYTSTAAATSHTVNHNLGTKYCNVTVVDSTDEVIIPQSILFTSTTALTVTFTSAINCKVIVMGVA